MAAVATATLFPYPLGVVNVVGALQLNGTLAFAAGTYTAGGLPLSFNTLAAGLNQSQPPLACQIYSPSSGYQYEYDLATQKVRIFQGGAAVSEPLAELASGVAVPAGVTGDAPSFSATVLKG